MLNVVNQAFSKSDRDWNVRHHLPSLKKCCSRTVLPSTGNQFTKPRLCFQGEAPIYSCLELRKPSERHSTRNKKDIGKCRLPRFYLWLLKRYYLFFFHSNPKEPFFLFCFCFLIFEIFKILHHGLDSCSNEQPGKVAVSTECPCSCSSLHCHKLPLNPACGTRETPSSYKSTSQKYNPPGCVPLDVLRQVVRIHPELISWKSPWEQIPAGSEEQGEVTA